MMICNRECTKITYEICLDEFSFGG